MRNSCGSGENIYYSDLGHKWDQTIQRIRSSMNCFLPVKTSPNQNNEKLELIVLVCSNQCFITYNTQQGTWTASYPLWGVGFDLCYFPAIRVGDPIARDPCPCQPKIVALITPSPRQQGGPAVPHRTPRPGAASTHAAVEVRQSWPDTPTLAKHLWQVCPHRVQRGW